MIRKLGLGLALCMGLASASQACELCRLVVSCNPDCEPYLACRSMTHFGETGRYECDDTGGSCTVGGGFCQWTELRKLPSPSDQLAALFALPERPLPESKR
jgi:hypothetical protein